MFPFRGRRSSKTNAQLDTPSSGSQLPEDDTPSPMDGEITGRMVRRGSSNASFWEYSDTSMDLDSPVRKERETVSSMSAFRLRRDTVTKSMRTVRFDPAQQLDDDAGGGNDDEEKQVSRTAGKSHHHHHHKSKHSSRRSQRYSKKSSQQNRLRQHPGDREDVPDRDSSMAWMKQLAYSFRTPSPRISHHKQSTQEYPHVAPDDNTQRSVLSDTLPTETAPLLSVTSHSSQEDDHNETDYVAVAASFLQDYEANRPPTLSSRRVKDISPDQLRLYQFRYGNVTYSILYYAAACSFFLSSFLEGFYEQYWYHRLALTILNLFGITMFVIEIVIHHELHRQSKSKRRNKQIPSRSDMAHTVRVSRSNRLVQPLILFSIVLALENLARLIVIPNNSLILFTSVFKPLVLYYASSRARDALEALRRIMRLVLRVILMELLLILMFAAVACRLFQDNDKFHDLSTAWLSLFELATTVVNPSLWMPMYQANKGSAFFFIFFIVTSVFYMHSLVLSVVFQTYIHAATEIHERSSKDREDAIELAYVALKHVTYQPGNNNKRDVVHVRLVREMLQLLRPHYNAMKINALCEIVAPSNQSTVDFPAFRTKVRQALNASIRTARSASPMAMTAELVAVVVALVNFVYVMLVSSDFSADWFESSQEWIGCSITLVAGLELAIRFNPFRIPDFTPLTRLNATFDGFALLAALVSAMGMILFIFGHKGALELILTGRSMDIFRIMRFFQIFRDIVRRSSDVFPALVGPLILVVSTIHIFVYLGIAIWGGAIAVGSYGDSVAYLYDLNNFNSYQEGVVTMFQVMVVNDWNQIANVFSMSSRFSDPSIVYPFFVIGNLIGVSIMLNVLTAFFVETFVTKVNDDTDGPAEATAMVHKDREYSIKTSENSPSKRILAGNIGNAFQDNDNDADSEGSSDSELYEFDVYEREGYDRIMQTVGSNATDHGDFARNICSYLEIFESLSPNREAVGWLVCDQHTLERFGNARFQTKASSYMEDSELHSIVSGMHAELLALATRASFQDRSLIRRFPSRNGGAKHLEISASLLRRHPALSLFVSQEVET